MFDALIEKIKNTPIDELTKELRKLGFAIANKNPKADNKHDTSKQHKGIC